MSFHRDVDVRMWSDQKFLSLSRPPPNARELWFYLLTCPETCTVPGLLRLGRAGLAEALGWPVEETAVCFDEIEQRGMAMADWNARVIFLPNRMKYGPTPNPDWVAGWGAVLDAIPDCDLKQEIHRRLRDHLFSLSRTSKKQVKTVEAFDRGTRAGTRAPPQGSPPVGTGTGSAPALLSKGRAADAAASLGSVPGTELAVAVVEKKIQPKSFSTTTTTPLPPPTEKQLAFIRLWASELERAGMPPETRNLSAEALENMDQLIHKAWSHDPDNYELVLSRMVYDLLRDQRFFAKHLAVIVMPAVWETRLAKAFVDLRADWETANRNRKKFY